MRRPFSVAVVLSIVVGLALPALAQQRGEVETLKEELRKLQQRIERLESAPVPVSPALVTTPVPAAAPVSEGVSASGPAGPTVALPAVGPVLAQAPPAGEREIRLEREHIFETIGLAKPEIGGARFYGFFAASASYNSHIQFVPEFAGGAPAQADPESVNFRFDTFTLGVTKTFAAWLSAGATVEIESHRDRHSHGFDPVFGCPGTGTCFERFGAEEAETTTDLHRFHITGVAPLGNGLALSFGRFDVPFGLERHDQNLLLTATTSEVFRFGRPSSMTGFQASYQFAPWLDFTTWVANRWESVTTHDPFDDNNRDKSFGGRLGITPVAGGRLLNFGVGGWWGPEQDDDTGNERWVLDLDVTWTPLPRLLLAGEVVYGGENGVSFRERGIPIAAPAVSDKSVNWWGLYVLGHYDFYDWLGLTLRYGYFRDFDAARTGVEQTLQSLTIAPVFHVSRLVPALRPLGVTYPRTAHPLHWVDVKLEYRLNHSSDPVFSDARPAVDILSADEWSHQVQLQFVVNF